MDLEQLWYEAFPYLYAIGGVCALFVRAESGLLKVSGVLLIVAAATILRLRWVYRRAHYLSLPTAGEAVTKSGAED